ncbi:MAG: hypothetical protein WC121_06245 [Candidatus Kapaibacterium sp.]
MKFTNYINPKLIISLFLLLIISTQELSTGTHQANEVELSDTLKNSTLEDIRIDSNFFRRNLLKEIECQYNKADSICPVCSKIDKVIPIEYGYLVITKEEYEKRNDKNQKEDLRTFKSGGCEISGCDPFWYCKRDSISF